MNRVLISVMHSAWPQCVVHFKFMRGVTIQVEAKIRQNVNQVRDLCKAEVRPIIIVD
jgi:hypothetical protein